MIGWDGTLWTGAKLAACAKELFRIVTDEAGKERMTTVDISIAKDHFDAINTYGFEGFGDLMYTGMVEVRNGLALGSTAVDMFKLCCWEIGKEDLTMVRGFSADFLWQVPNSKV